MSRERAHRIQPVVISVIAALMLAIAPMPEWAEAFRPNWVALTLIYWAMNLPATGISDRLVTISLQSSMPLVPGILRSVKTAS